MGHLFWRDQWGLVAYGEPVTISLQTSLQELVPLQIATGNLHPLHPLACRGQVL